MLRFTLIVGVLLVSAAAIAQPTSRITTPQQATVQEPLLVEAPNGTGAAITGTNTSGEMRATSSGVKGQGYAGVVGEGVLFGVFGTSSDTGVRGEGFYRGVDGFCLRSICTAVRGVSEGIAGTGVYGAGGIGIWGVARSTPEGGAGAAGYFVGDVGITENLRVDGTISSPIVAQLTAEVASLTARLSALEALPALVGVIPRAVPGRIEAEAYDVGGQGIGYLDATAGNEGGTYRSDDVDIKVSAEGGYAVGWITAGEWLAYTVSVAMDGTYNIQARVGSPLPGRTFHVEVDGDDVTGLIAVPQVSDWDQYVTVTASSALLSAGRHVLRVVMGAQDYMDFQWVEIRP